MKSELLSNIQPAFSLSSGLDEALPVRCKFPWSYYTHKEPARLSGSNHLLPPYLPLQFTDQPLNDTHGYFLKHVLNYCDKHFYIITLCHPHTLYEGGIDSSHFMNEDTKPPRKNSLQSSK